MSEPVRKRRTGNRPWKRTDLDRAWRARVERAIERGEYTPKGTISKKRPKKEAGP